MGRRRTTESAVDIEATGEWWNPGDLVTRWAGTLRIGQDGGARLILNDPPDLQILLRQHREYDALHGLTNDGKRVTLLRCFDVSTGGPSGGLGRREIFANAVLVGIHADGPDPLLSGVTGVFRHARSWYGRSNLRVADFVSMQTFKLAYEAAPAVTLYEEDGVTLRMVPTVASLPSALDEDGQFQVQEELRFTINTDTPRHFSELNRMLAACQDLLSVACQDYCDVERWCAHQGPGIETREASYHAEPVFRGNARKRGALQPLFCFDDIVDAPSTYFTRWLNEAERLSSIRSLYFLAVYGDQFVQGRFMALAQAIEAFHRRYRQGEYMDPSAFEMTVAKSLYAAIPKGIDSSLMQSMRSRIKFGNEYSLPKRLTDLLTEHLPALEPVVPDPKRLVREIAERRNRFTHFPDLPDSTDDTGAAWLGYNALLRLLLELSFLKLIGFNDEKLKELVDRGHGRLQMIRRFLP